MIFLDGFRKYVEAQYLKSLHLNQSFVKIY